MHNNMLISMCTDMCMGATVNGITRPVEDHPERLDAGAAWVREPCRPGKTSRDERAVVKGARASASWRRTRTRLWKKRYTNPIE